MEKFDKTIGFLYYLYLKNKNYRFKQSGLSIWPADPFAHKNKKPKLKDRFMLFFFGKYWSKKLGWRMDIKERGVLKRGVPDEGLARIQKMFESSNGRDKCRWAWCGADADYGFYTCETHRNLCCVCNRNESTININGKSYCYDWQCTRESNDKSY